MVLCLSSIAAKLGMFAGGTGMNLSTQQLGNTPLEAQTGLVGSETVASGGQARPRAANPTLRSKRSNAKRRPPKKLKRQRQRVKVGRRDAADVEESSSEEEDEEEASSDEEDGEGEEESASESGRTTEPQSRSGPSAQSDSGDGPSEDADAQSSSESSATTEASSLAELASPARLEFLQRTHSMRMRVHYKKHKEHIMQ